ncbi:MAG: deaminase [Oscillospiraceae bacterium]|nr:deaminase [Oscillospiraceae bacterium]
MKRRDRINYYLDIALVVSERGTCLRRKFGSIIVNNDEIISTGFVGSPRGRENCCDRGVCLRDELKIPKGRQYEICRSVHAEANCIISAARRDMLGGTLYLACRDAKTGETDGEVEPCAMCKRLIINAGISTVIIRVTNDEYRSITVEKWIEEDDTKASIGNY